VLLWHGGSIPRGSRGDKRKRAPSNSAT
jgi:hypothetical protein